jgi:hypothetical protein
MRVGREQNILEKPMVLWLVADDSRLVTTQSFVVDGGWA